MPDCDGDEDECAIDPPCKEDYVRWLKYKRAYFKIMNNEVNLSHNQITNPN